MPTVERLKHQLMELGIITLITVIVWIGYGVYSALTDPANVQVSEEELRPMPKNLNLQQLEKLKDRLSLSEEQLKSFSPSEANVEIPPTIEEIPTVAPTPIPASPAAVVSESTTSALNQ